MLKNLKNPITLAEQGNYMVGGRVKTKGGTEQKDQMTIHGDHAYVFYQIPVERRELPLIFLHGHGQCGSSSWGMTPDGRDGFQTIFLQQDFAVYLLDQPRRGQAGRSLDAGTISPSFDEQKMFNTYRLGLWPDYYPNVSFKCTDEVLEEFMRRNTPNTADFDLGIVADGVAAALRKVGSSILITHSQGGGVGWEAAMEADNVAAIVAYEPGSNFPFPEGEAPDEIISKDGKDILYPREVKEDEFRKLCKMPIVIYYGDNIPEEPDDDPGKEHWRLRQVMAEKFAAKVNAYGGDAKVVSLPKVGICGNGHFPFSDTNNVDVANCMMTFLEEKGLDRY